MSYKKGAEVLPAHLLKEIQKYVEGSLIYIPKKTPKVGWGYLSGTRKALDQRNEKIIHLYEKGMSVDELSEKFYLEKETIQKIIYGKKQSEEQNKN